MMFIYREMCRKVGTTKNQRGLQNTSHVHKVSDKKIYFCVYQYTLEVDVTGNQYSFLRATFWIKLEPALSLLAISCTSKFI